MTNEKLQKDNGVSNANASHYGRVIESILYLTTTQLDIMCVKYFIKISIKPISNNSIKNSKILTRHEEI